jgi:predicted ATP-grasp superfamily ATP-dependent carboligase
MPYPAASLALLEALDRVAQVNFGVADLADEARATRNRLDELVSNSPEHLELVRQLEVQVDAIDREGIEAVSGDELAEELERYLREQGP